MAKPLSCGFAFYSNLNGWAPEPSAKLFVFPREGYLPRVNASAGKLFLEIEEGRFRKICVEAKMLERATEQSSFRLLPWEANLRQTFRELPRSQCSANLLLTCPPPDMLVERKETPLSFDKGHAEVHTLKSHTAQVTS